MNTAGRTKVHGADQLRPPGGFVVAGPVVFEGQEDDEHDAVEDHQGQHRAQRHLAGL